MLFRFPQNDDHQYNNNNYDSRATDNQHNARALDHQNVRDENTVQAQNNIK